MKIQPDCEIIDYQSKTLRNICECIFLKKPDNKKEIIKEYYSFSLQKSAFKKTGNV